MERKELLYIVVLVVFLFLIVGFYFQSRRYIAIYEEAASYTGEMTIKVKFAPSEEFKEEILPPPQPEGD